MGCVTLLELAVLPQEALQTSASESRMCRGARSNARAKNGVRMQKAAARPAAWQAEATPTGGSGTRVPVFVVGHCSLRANRKPGDPRILRRR